MLAKQFIKGVRTRFSADAYLCKVGGVIHVGANSGQERNLYAQLQLDVAWVEPNPPVFERLRANLAEFPKQRAYQYLIADQDEQEYIFHVASNGGESSSILPLAKHREMWPEIHYSSDIKLKSITLASFLEREGLDTQHYQALILDTQGSELMILRGSRGILPRFRFIKVEVPDFPSYEGCCQLSEMDSFMKAEGFCERRRDNFQSVTGVGNYFDVLYERQGWDS